MEIINNKYPQLIRNKHKKKKTIYMFMTFFFFFVILNIYLKCNLVHITI